MIDLVRVHDQPPSRRVVAVQLRYSLYRDDLKKDFSNACGYCGDDDERADRSTFHIDHFAPQKHFPKLKLEYSNLVYACRFCNVSKSDHWVGIDAKIPNNGAEGFIDPCSEDYSVHLGRDSGGCIVAKTPLGRYIIRRLNLNLMRHELLWRARRARALRDKIQALIEQYKARGKPLPEYASLLERFYELTKSIDDYELRAVPR
jgi:uncharacterized protein (TIGR02646 family)